MGRFIPFFGPQRLKRGLFSTYCLTAFFGGWGVPKPFREIIPFVNFHLRKKRGVKQGGEFFPAAKFSQGGPQLKGGFTTRCNLGGGSHTRLNPLYIKPFVWGNNPPFQIKGTKSSLVVFPHIKQGVFFSRDE